MNVEVFFDPDHLKPILAEAAQKIFKKPVTADQILSLEFPRDPDDGETVGVTIEFDGDDFVD